MRILLVEDNPGDARLLKERLAEAGASPLQVAYADRLAAGIERLGDANPDVVLLDLSLPDSYGLETLTRMHAAANGVPIVVLTSLEDEALGLQLIRAGAQDYLVKGQITGPLLLRALRYAAERKRVQEKLVLYREIFANSSDAIAIIDPQGHYLEQNAAHRALLGYSDAELHGKTPASHLGDETFARIVGELAGKGSYRGEVTSRTKSGSMLEIDLSAFAVRNDAGDPVCYVGIKRDITERRRAEEERGRLARSFQLLLDSTGEGIYGVDLHGRCTFINKAGAEMLGYQPEEVLGKDMHDLIHHHRPDGSPYPRDACRIYRAFRNRQGCHVDDEMLWRRDGTPFPAEYFSYPIVEKDITTGAVVTFTDITERRRAEAEREEALRQLRALSRRLETVREEERTRIARELHDELGVMLTCLKIDLSQLNRAVSMVDTHAVRVHLQDKILSMMQPIDNTIALVQRLVTDLRPGVLDDLGLVAALEWLAQEFHKRTGIACVFRSSLEDVEIDREQATTAFRICQEALTNVARHARATEVTVCLEQTSRRLLLEVKDNGRGIPAEKVSDAQSLGLLGMRERAERLGGTVIVTGRPGEGTTVTVSLPRRLETE